MRKGDCDVKSKANFRVCCQGVIRRDWGIRKTSQKRVWFSQKIDNGEKVNSSKTKFEILEICRVKKAESARLDREKFDLSWQVNVEMND